MNEPLDPATVALIGLALAVAAGDEPLLVAASRSARAADVPLVWVDELLLQSILMVGWPRALVAALVWRRESGTRAPAADRSKREGIELWTERGEATCREVYGTNFDRLRENVNALHPAMATWMIADGYGKVLSRPGLDLLRREWCIIAQIALLGAERQLHSHLRGALNAGGTEVQLNAVLDLVAPRLSEQGRELAQKTWAKVVRPTPLTTDN